uniref:Uncharacterized protein n=1 Tax=Rhizophora mucronata TaxID=61149 RepID=A0A2P2Q6D2_RHIMU
MPSSMFSASSSISNWLFCVSFQQWIKICKFGSFNLNFARCLIRKEGQDQSSIPYGAT